MSCYLYYQNPKFPLYPAEVEVAVGEAMVPTLEEFLQASAKERAQRPSVCKDEIVFPCCYN